VRASVRACVCACPHSTYATQITYCDLLLWSGETLDNVSRTQEACFRALAGRHQVQQAAHLDIVRHFVCKLSQDKVEDSFSLWYSGIKEREKGRER
jgi:hypothetical protein